ncbi:helix-turn-helix transcriptional regulator [Flavobacteriaceae bacterium]|jgi:DNA-binding HxlR family transcriptional regulator|nr:helix-turn-helix transcriptional regulator [Flavobacteriaceae bacterium]|tara:strand:+ start:3064 stop:3495 length:432 start_codon:yes stop_codon:yes gene_type:complete
MKTNRSHCPLTNILDIIGDKWSLIIVRDLFLEKKTFTEFMKSSEKIASNILTNRLELLINHGLLEVTKLPNDNKTKIYHLTNKGIDLYPIMFEMMCWSKRNLDKGFGPIGEEFFKDIQGISSEQFIKNTQSTYVKYRDHILSV